MNVTTIVFGRSYILTRRAQDSGVDVVVHPFQGGYDDYDGAMGWAEWPGEITGKVQRFSPGPGCWMSGVRLAS